jgi:formylglycine-generating enzyme required for sulfatase activity
VLADVAGEDSVYFFLRLAHDDPDRQEAALWSLGQMGRQPNEALRERVLERLLAHFQGEELRQEAGVALVYIREAEIDDRVLLAVLRGEPDAGIVATLAGMLDRKVVEIPAGEFLMGDEKRKVYVDTFRIDKYPVTNVQYRRFVEATNHSPPGRWVGGACPAEKALHPVVYVSWDDAVAYAEWAGKRLSTEEEWEKAARGTDGREYPWGDWKEGRCNTWEVGIHDTIPVGRYSPRGDSPYGCADMAGNVWEWTASSWEPGSSRRVVRGGSWGDNRDFARCATRRWSGPVTSVLSGGDVGFRCVSPV